MKKWSKENWIQIIIALLLLIVLWYLGSVLLTLKKIKEEVFEIADGIEVEIVDSVNAPNIPGLPPLPKLP